MSVTSLYDIKLEQIDEQNEIDAQVTTNDKTQTNSIQPPPIPGGVMLQRQPTKFIPNIEDYVLTTNQHPNQLK